MAVEFIDYQQLNDSDGTWNTTISVPADCTYALIYLSGWNSPAATVSAAPAINSSGATHLSTYTSTEGNQSYLYGKLSPSTGSVSFTAAMSKAWAEGGIAIVLYFKGVNTSTPVADSDSANSGSSGATISLTLDSTSGDLGVIVGAGYQGAIDFEKGSQTLIFEYVSGTGYNSDYCGAAYLTATSSTVSLSMSGEWPGAAAAVLKPAAGGASSTPTLKRRLNILLRLCLSTFNLIWRCFK